jgi:imidazolonepropionase-like amidohydrolase
LITNKELFTKDFKILENWVLGKQEFKSITNSKDLRGNYKLITGNNEKKLLISGSIDKPKAELKFRILKDSLLNGRPVISPSGDFVKIKSEKTVKVNFSLYDNDVTISYSEGDNLIRLNGKIENDGQKWNGEGRDKYGEWFNWKAEKSKVQNITKTDTASKKIIKKNFTKNKHLDFCPSKQPEFSNVLFENATIWTADDLETFKGKLWIRDGKIIDVGENIDLGNYNNIKVIDLKGKHITPGIIDEHSHIAIQSGVNEGSNAVTSEVRIGDVINPEDINIYRQLAGGVTSAQLLHGSANPIGGQSAIIKMRWGQTAEEMKIKTAPKFIKFALGENVKQSNWGWRYSIRYPQTRMGVEQIYYDAFIEAKEYQNKIDDFNNLPKKVKKIEPKKDLQLEALSEIINEKRFITCHSYIQSEINMLMKMADSMGFRINTFTHILEGYKVADKMKAHGVGASTFSDWWAYKYEVRDAIPHNACLLTKMGIVTAINSDDAEMGRRLNQEASKAIKYGGCSENEAIKLVTINPAKLLHIDDRTGSIKKGKDADIVIWDHSPLSVYAKVEQTYVDGRLLYDYIIQEKLFEENQKNRSNIISEMILAKKNGAQTQRIKKQDNKLHKCNEFEIDE